ncbi:MAG TPA: hypothetical protein VGY96_13255 [Streptosporangiaceae bacterium]|nr:hypothetical protein [Streptosporangiaceae bacterium]
MTFRTAGRFRLTPRRITMAVAAVIVVLLAFMGTTASLTSAVTVSKVWSAAGILTIILVTAAVGLFVAGHQPRNPIGWLLAGEAVFMLLSVASGTYAELVYRLGYHDLAFAGPSALVLSQLFSYSLAGFPLLILLFPDGRLPSRRWRWVAWTYLAIATASVLATSIAVLGLVIGHHVVLQADGNLASLGSGSTAWMSPLVLGFFVTVAAFWLAATGRQVLSWRRSSGERRQQLKWLASGAAICGVFGIWAIATNSAIWQVLILGFAALPLSIGIAILKYRLYEIDRIISRTLAYAIVTGLLVGVYAGLVLLATGVLGLHSSVAVAAATLAAAALFSPVRRRVQRVVDRRFNRARYDADQTVAAFAAGLKDAVDLDSVQTDLTRVVHQALEPAYVSVWIRPE